jgi:hypothetical protein
MPNLQPTYNDAPVAGFVGRIADATPATVISRENDIAAATNIAFGRVVVRGSDPANTVKDGALGTAFLGIALVNVATRPDAADQYQPGDVVAVLTRGCVWVNGAVAVNAGDSAYFTSAGAITNVSTSNTAIPNAKFDSTTSGAGLAKLRLS